MMGDPNLFKHDTKCLEAGDANGVALSTTQTGTECSSQWVWLTGDLWFGSHVGDVLRPERWY